MDGKTRMITVATFTFLGIYSITCGAIYPKYQEARTPKTSFLLIEQKQIGIKKEVSLKLKEITTEVNIPLSVKIIDYLEGDVSSEVLAELKLDTSEVNVQQPGEYTYKIYYKKKVFKGKVIVKEKEIKEPEVIQQTITLRPITIKLGELIPTDLSVYIIEPLTDEMKINMKLDLSQIDPNRPGEYTYTIWYNGAYYQGQFTIVEDKPIVSGGTQESNQGTGEQKGGNSEESSENNGTNTQ